MSYDRFGPGIPAVEEGEMGLADRSEELEELTEKDIRIRFYQSMAAINENEPGLALRLCQAIASVMYDFCSLHACDRFGELELLAAYDVNPALRTTIGDVIADGQVVPPAVVQSAVRLGQGTYLRKTSDDLTFAPGKDARRVTVHSLVVAPLTSAFGEPFGALCVGRHATRRPYDQADRALLEWIASHVAMKLETARLYRDLRRTNQKLSARNQELALAVQARDDFLATASHELKTPLSTLVLQIELLQRELLDGPVETAVRLGHNVEVLTRQARRLSSLVGQLLDVSRLTEGHLDFVPKRTDLPELVREVCDRFAAEAERSGVSIELDARPVVGMWDPDRLDQVVSNLVSNALKYGGGRDVHVHVYPIKGDAVVEVHDQGDGIPAEVQALIFERFERAVSGDQKGGLGLGLWIVNQIVQRSGGAVEVDSEPGKGSTFRVTLPLT